MVEKWLKGPKIKNKLHYGKPAYLFGDADKDGVMNVFDCKPKNKNKQDVIAPLGGQNPVYDMWGRAEWARQVREARRQQELQNLQNQTIIERTTIIREPSVSGSSFTRNASTGSSSRIAPVGYTRSTNTSTSYPGFQKKPSSPSPSSSIIKSKSSSKSYSNPIMSYGARVGSKVSSFVSKIFK